MNRIKVDDFWSKEARETEVTKLCSESPEVVSFATTAKHHVKNDVNHYRSMETRAMRCFEHVAGPLLTKLLEFTLAHHRLLRDDEKDIPIVLDLDALYSWTGALFLMGSNPLTDLETYWNTTDPTIASLPLLTTQWTRKKWLFVYRTLKIYMPSAETPVVKGDKFLPLATTYADTIRSLFNVGSNLTFDESMVRTKGRCSWIQRMPFKPIRYGQKVFCLNCAETSLLLCYSVYTGTVDVVQMIIDQIMSLSLVHRAVLYADRFFGSVVLAKKLLMSFATPVHLVATMSTNRTNKKEPLDGLPTSDGFAQKFKASTLRGTLYRRCQQVLDSLGLSHILSVYKLMDNGTVYLIDTLSKTFNVTNISRKVREAGVWITKNFSFPEIVSLYNKYKGGTDRMDQSINFSMFDHSTRKYTVRILVWQLEVALHASWILYKLCVSHFEGVACPDFQTFKRTVAHLCIKRKCVRDFRSVEPTEGCQMPASVSLDFKTGGVQIQGKCRLCGQKGIRTCCFHCGTVLCNVPRGKSPHSCVSLFHYSHLG
jgi:hypothetical protein